jgi:hypothetical protein
LTRTNSVLLTITQAKLEAERKKEEAEEEEAARLQAAAEAQVRTLHQFVRTLACKLVRQAERLLAAAEAQVRTLTLASYMMM